jgi:hypothetical protein
LRGELLERHGMQKDFVKAAASWRHEASAVDETFEN